MKQNRFAKGTGCFVCECCGRRTRENGQGAGGKHTCLECWELAGLENAVLDGEPLEEVISERDRYVSALVKKGVALARIHAEFSDLF